MTAPGWPRRTCRQFLPGEAEGLAPRSRYTSGLIG